MSKQRVAGVILLKPNGDALFQLRDDKFGLTHADKWVFPGGHAILPFLIPIWDQAIQMQKRRSAS